MFTGTHGPLLGRSRSPDQSRAKPQRCCSVSSEAPGDIAIQDGHTQALCQIRDLFTLQTTPHGWLSMLKRQFFRNA